jgi:cytochrome c oxidase cbb3-type subunit III
MNSKRVRSAGLVFVVVGLWSCNQQQNDAATLRPPAGELVTGNRQSELQPGPASPAPAVKNPFEGNEAAIGEGKRLYSHFNCAGCHAAGGGAIGPALMDDEWIYGSDSSNIFWTIVEGRPQGMPAFGGRIARDEVWRIAAYVRSLSGLEKQESSNQQQ